MLPYLRYALAAVCFAASVGCAALWWRGQSTWDRLMGPSYLSAKRVFAMEFVSGGAMFTLFPENEWSDYNQQWTRAAGRLPFWRSQQLQAMNDQSGMFSAGRGSIYFPLWYPALILALAGVGILRFGRQFSIRSALVCLTVVAALLGMAVML